MDNQTLFDAARMGIVSKGTVVLRRWEIDEQELGLSTEALITDLNFTTVESLKNMSWRFERWLFVAPNASVDKPN